MAWRNGALKKKSAASISFLVCFRLIRNLIGGAAWPFAAQHAHNLLGGADAHLPAGVFGIPGGMRGDQDVFLVQ